PPPRRPDDGPPSGRAALGSPFSPPTQTTRENVARLAPAWTYHTGEPLPTQDHRRSLEVTPIVVSGTMYISTPLGKVIALDPVTGAEKWKFDTAVDQHAGFGDFTTRGVSYANGRIYFATTDARLIALDGATGLPLVTFGGWGTVDLLRRLRNAPFEKAEYEVTSPPAIVGDLVIVGSGVADNNR